MFQTKNTRMSSTFYIRVRLDVRINKNIDRRHRHHRHAIEKSIIFIWNDIQNENIIEKDTISMFS